MALISGLVHRAPPPAGTPAAEVCGARRAIRCAYYADDIGDDLEAAARQGACLRVSIGPRSGPRGTWKLRDSDPDNGRRCAA